MTLTEWTPTGWTPTGRWPRKTASGQREDDQRRMGRGEPRDYQETPLETTCKQADSEVRHTRCLYHQCASQRIRKHLSASLCAANHLKDVLSVSFEESRWQIPPEHAEVAGAGGRRNEMNLEAAGREFPKRLPQERMLSGRSELAEIELREYPTRPPSILLRRF